MIPLLVVTVVFSCAFLSVIVRTTRKESRTRTHLSRTTSFPWCCDRRLHCLICPPTTETTTMTTPTATTTAENICRTIARIPRLQPTVTRTARHRAQRPQAATRDAKGPSTGLVMVSATPLPTTRNVDGTEVRSIAAVLNKRDLVRTK